MVKRGLLNGGGEPNQFYLLPVDRLVLTAWYQKVFKTSIL